MKVLFISKGDLPDYQSDMVFHGGRSVLGKDFIDCNKLWYMYKRDKDLYWNERVPEAGKSYGRGFTMCGLFEQDDIDRSDISNKIKNHFFDKIIYGSCNRCTDHLDLVLENYDKQDIIFIDGEDNQLLNKDLIKLGRYYKREILSKDLDKAEPIHFAIPKEHILDHVPNKSKEYAHIIPGDISTYVYDNQEDYYKDYQNSYFGVTFKKGGWDCLRHYEIIMNGCIPYFPDLNECPVNTMRLFPKKLVLECNEKLRSGNLTEQDCIQYIEKLLDYAKRNLTTEKLFNYVIGQKNDSTDDKLQARFDQLKMNISSKKSCIIFAVSIFDKSKLHVLHEYLDVFKNNYSDCDFYIGINHGSINEIEDVISSYKLKTYITRTPEHLYCGSDASAYQSALKLLKQSTFRYDLYWFAHTKGAVNHRPGERTMYLTEMFSNREKIESLFDKHDRIGVYALRGVSSSAVGDNWATFNRDHHISICSSFITKDLKCTHVNWSYIETMYVINKDSIEKFLSLATEDFYNTKIEEKCYFEVIFPWIATRCGYFPYIEQSSCYFNKNISLKNITKNWIIENNLLDLTNYLEL